MGVTGIGIGIGIGPFDLNTSGSALDVITSSNGAWWVTKERGKNWVRDSSDPRSDGVDWNSFRAATLVSSSGGPIDTRWLLQDDASTGSNRVLIEPRTLGDLGTNVDVAVSFYAAPNTVNWAQFSTSTYTGIGPFGFWDLQNGVVGTSYQATMSIEDAGGGWYRCKAVFTTGADGDGRIYIGLASADNTPNVTLDGSNSIYIAGVQVEKSSTVTSYEETTGNALAGALLDQTGGGRHLLLPGGSANPVLLDHTGTDYFWLPGTTGNYLSVPDSAALSVTGDIDLQARIEMDDLTPATIGYVIGKFNGGTNGSYGLRIDTAGRLQGLANQNGVSTTILTSSAALSTVYSPGDKMWVRVAIDVDNGASGLDMTFYTGGTGETPSWTQLGTVQTDGTVLAIDDSATNVLLGAAEAGGPLQQFRLYRAIIKDGIDGTTVLDVNAADADPNSTTFTEASSNAATVTINRSSTGYVTEVVDQPKYGLSTDDYLYAADDALFDIGASDDFTAILVARLYYVGLNFLLIGKRNAATFAEGWSFYKTNAGGTWWVRVEETAAAGGSDIFDATPDLILNTTHSFAMRVDRTTDELEGFLDGVGTGGGADISALGDCANSNQLRIGTGGTDGVYAGMSLIGAATIKQALTAAEISDIADALIAANGGTP